MPTRSSAGTASTGAATASSIHNVLASYAHLRSAGGNAWAARFVDFVRHADYRRSRQDNIVYLPPARGREAMVM